MESEIDEMAMVDRGDEQLWKQQSAGSLTLDDIDVAMELLRNQGATPDVMLVSPYVAEHWDEINRRIQSEITRGRQRRKAEQSQKRRKLRLARRQRRVQQRKHQQGKSRV